MRIIDKKREFVEQLYAKATGQKNYVQMSCLVNYHNFNKNR